MTGQGQVVGHSQPRDVVVAVLDVLGFSARVGHTDLSLLVADYRDLIERKKRASHLPALAGVPEKRSTKANVLTA